MIVSTRMSVTITRYRTQVTMGEMVVQLHETVWGPPKAGLAETVREARRLKIAQSIDGAFLGGRFGSQKTLTLDVWLPEPVIKNITPAANSAAQAMPVPAPRLALGGPALNHWQGSVNYAKSLRGLSGGLFGLGAVLTICNLNWSLVQLQRALGNSTATDAELTEVTAGIVSGTVGVMALTAEMYAGVVQGRVSRAVMTSTGNRLLARAALTKLAGGVLGTIMAGVEFVMLWKKSVAAGDGGDLDARSSYRYAAVFTAVAGVAGLSIALITAAKALVAVNATSAAATAVVGGASVVGVIPVAGWIVLLIGGIAAGLYFGYQAAVAEDTPLEIWLSRSFYRNEGVYAGTNREKFNNLKTEMAEFQQAIYGLTVTLEWNDRIGWDRIELGVLMPGYAEGRSEYGYLLAVSQNGLKTVLITRHTSRFSQDPDLRPQPRTPVYVSASPDVPSAPRIEIEEAERLQISSGVGRIAAR